MKYEVTITVRCLAKDAKEAREVGIGAAQHLFETFNDDESLKAIRVGKAVEYVSKPKKKAAA